MAAPVRVPEIATLDTSSADAYRQSIAAVRQSLPEGRRKDLDAALMQITFASVPSDGNNPFGKLASFAAMARDPVGMVRKLGPLVHGKTGLELFPDATNRPNSSSEHKSRSNL